MNDIQSDLPLDDRSAPDGPDGFETMTLGQFCAAAISSNEATQDGPMCPEPPDGLYPMPNVQSSPYDSSIEQPELGAFLTDVAVGVVVGAVKTESPPAMAFNIVTAFAIQAGAGEFVDSVSASIQSMDSSNFADASVPDASTGDESGAILPGGDGGGSSEIGAADPGETDGGDGHYVAPLGTGSSDGAADPGETDGGDGEYVGPVGTGGSDGAADPDQNPGGGHYVRPIGTGISDGGAGPGGDGGGGGDDYVGGGHSGGRSSRGGPVKEE